MKQISHFQTLQNCFVQNCQELSLTSEATEDVSYAGLFHNGTHYLTLIFTVESGHFVLLLCL